ncbi:hypothetical protein BTM_1579 [Burkholderia thailandensis 34]|uniref:DUF2806 domain-containing protein n=1 Tax=Burkholderia thailandensis TaxID=57975 RepID=UPI0005D7B3A6|nr:DUF2806 domain-containing protein [Burkholderia thailandensis]AJY29249.1 hypothetical protein BTM_1579 [Burkholderia thailandensis 34]
MIEMPGEKLLSRMWETLDKGVSASLRPWQIRREDRARIEGRERELLVIAQAERHAEEIRAGRMQIALEGDTVRRLPGDAELMDGRAEPGFSLPAMLARAHENNVLRLLQEEINVAKSVQIAGDILAKDPSAAPADFADPDWLTRWRNSAAQMSSDQLQTLFAQVLASEIKAPGSISLRTLDFLKNLSRDEAERMQFVCPFMANGRYVFMYGPMQTPQAFHDNPEFPFFLQELGLLSGNGYQGNSVRQFKSECTSDFRAVLRFNDRAVIVRGPDPSAILELHGFKATPVGVQALSLCPMSAPESYLQAVAAHCKLKGFDVAIASRLIHLDGAEEKLFDEVAI